MGDFLGSYFTAADENQLWRDIKLYGELQSPPSIRVESSTRHASQLFNEPRQGDIGGVPDGTEDEGDDFVPVTVTSMSKFDPTSSLFSIQLTRKGTSQFTGSPTSRSPRGPKSWEKLGVQRHVGGQAYHAVAANGPEMASTPHKEKTAQDTTSASAKSPDNTTTERTGSAAKKFKRALLKLLGKRSAGGKPVHDAGNASAASSPKEDSALLTSPNSAVTP